MPLFVIEPTQGSQTSVDLPNETVADKSIELLDVILPSTFYKIRTGVNDKLDFKVGATTYAITVPAAAYTSTTLLAAIQTLMQSAVANTWALTFSNDTMLVTIAATGAFSLLLSSGTNVATSIGPLLGFAVTDITTVTTTTATSVIQLFKPFMLYLRINEMGNNVFVGQTAALARGFSFLIPATVASGGIIEATVNGNYRQVIPVKQRTVYPKLTIQLCYSDGTAVNLNGAGYSFLLKIE